MTRGPRRLRNLNLEAQDAGQEHQEPDDLADDEIEENLQGPPDVDNILARMPNQRASPIKIICKFDISFGDTSKYNRWRAYKSKLKKEHFNREERSLEQIIQGRPRTVNEHQWRSLVSFWCQETHKVISQVVMVYFLLLVINIEFKIIVMNM